MLAIAAAALSWLDSGVCSQGPVASFWLAGRQLPLCARNLGLFGGFLLLGVLRSWRPSGLRSSHVGPAPAMLRPLAGSRGLGRGAIAWQPLHGRSPLYLAGLLPFALDGANAFASSTFGLAAYPPGNLVRLLTGLLAGGCLAVLLRKASARRDMTTGAMVDQEALTDSAPPPKRQDCLDCPPPGTSPAAASSFPLRGVVAWLLFFVAVAVPLAVHFAEFPLTRAVARAFESGAEALAASAQAGAYLALALIGTFGVLALLASANRLASPRLARLSWLLTLPELAGLALLKHGLLALLR